MDCILTNFLKWGKGMLRLFPLFLLFSYALGGCLYHLEIENSKGELNHLRLFSPVAIFPMAQVPGFPESEIIFSQILQDLLKERGISFIPPAETATLANLEAPFPPVSPQFLSANNFKKKLAANFLLEGSFLEYRKESSSLGSGAFPTWDGTREEFFILPTYRQGDCQIKIRLLLWDLEKNSLSWKKEGKISGPAFTYRLLIRKLLKRLWVDFPL